MKLLCGYAPYFDYAQYEVVACAVYVLLHRVRQPAAVSKPRGFDLQEPTTASINIVIVKLCVILFIVSRPVVPLFWVRSADSSDRLLVGELASGGVARHHTLWMVYVNMRRQGTRLGQAD